MNSKIISSNLFLELVIIILIYYKYRYYSNEDLYSSLNSQNSKFLFVHSQSLRVQKVSRCKVGWLKK